MKNWKWFTFWLGLILWVWTKWQAFMGWIDSASTGGPS